MLVLKVIIYNNLYYHSLIIIYRFFICLSQRFFHFVGQFHKLLHRQLFGAFIKNNIFWTNTDGTGNVVIIRPQITSPTGDICADNLLYKTMTYNWQMFYGGKLPFEGAEELKALTSNPFDGGTFDLANGIFVPNAEYAEYGATN